MIEGIATSNKMPFCQSEIETFVEYVSNLVTDLESGVFSRDDFRMLWENYGDDSEPNGTNTP